MNLPVSTESVNEITVCAGKIIMEVYEYADFTTITDYKTNDSPLTLADKRAHEFIAGQLTKIYPDIPLISEEGRDMPYETRRFWDFYWLVDPLDGTKEFLKKNGEFTVNIALMYQNKPVFGWVYVPVTSALYYGSVESGAYKMINGKTHSIKVSGRKTGMVAIGSRSHASDNEKKILSEYPVGSTITAGSSLKFCLIAEGKADIYYREGPTMEWDTAAGHALVESAGGTMMDAFKQPFLYNKPSLLNSSFLCLGV